MLQIIETYHVIINVMRRKVVITAFIFLISNISIIFIIPKFYIESPLLLTRMMMMF